MKKKSPNPLNPFDWFVPGKSEEPTTTDYDEILTKMAEERFTLPRKVKALRDENTRLKRDLTDLRRRVRPSKNAADLRQIISSVKTAHPGFSHLSIAKRVDYILLSKKRSLLEVAPKSWRPLPNKMEEIFIDDKHKILKNLAKAYISKA
jgi:hypothetical protein